MVPPRLPTSKALSPKSPQQAEHRANCEHPAPAHVAHTNLEASSGAGALRPPRPAWALVKSGACGLGFLAAILPALLAAATTDAPQRPNVIVILTDDQGWGDLSLHGNQNLSTPHIDSLARDGVAFDNFYVCAVCAPTRAEFLTGRYHPRTGVTGVSRGEERMTTGETTIAERFHNAGYATAAFGKWHNGTQSPLHPLDQGFDAFYGFTSGHWGHYFSPPLDHNGQRVRGAGYLPNDLTNHAIQFIRQQAKASQPFFCYVPFNTPHSPMMVPDRFYEKFANAVPAMKHREPHREDLAMTRAALAMCENIDWNVGRMLTALEELDLTRDTIVVFFCDNGPNSFRWNGGMKGRKGSIDEGGLRSPMLIRWPSQLKAGVKVAQVAGAIDLLPTLTELCGLSSSESPLPLDGLSLAPLLKQSRQVQEKWEERMLFAYRKDAVSVRMGDFRLDAAGRLYDVRHDRGQRDDVSAQHPQVVRQMQAAAEGHLAEMRQAIAAYGDRPFHVGHGRVSTLPARDGIPHGKIQRSSKAPNNSFFKNWVDPMDEITWDVTARPGRYRVTVFYTCAPGREGAVVQVTAGKDRIAMAKVAESFDPPLYDKSKERVAKSHYFVKDFKPLVLGEIDLSGRHTLRLGVKEPPPLEGDASIIDVHSLDLVRLDTLPGK